MGPPTAAVTTIFLRRGTLTMEHRRQFRRLERCRCTMETLLGRMVRVDRGCIPLSPRIRLPRQQLPSNSSSSPMPLRHLPSSSLISTLSNSSLISTLSLTSTGTRVVDTEHNFRDGQGCWGVLRGQSREAVFIFPCTIFVLHAVGREKWGQRREGRFISDT